MRIVLTVVAVVCLLSGCVSHTANRGVAVDILRPVKMEDGHCDKIGLIWLDSSRVVPAPGVRLSASERRMIAEQVREICARTRYLITTTAQPELDGSEYHLMTIRVNEVSVVSSRDNAVASKVARVALGVTLKQGGVLECYTAPPVVREFKRQAPLYEAERLPSDFELKTEAIRRSLETIVATFSPDKVKTFRPVRGGTGQVGQVGDLIDGGMYEQALLSCKAYLEEHPDDAAALYSAGLASECLAGKARDDRRRLKALNLALEYYNQAVLRDSGDPESTRAAREVAQEVELYLDAMARRGKACDDAKVFDTSTGF